MDHEGELEQSREESFSSIREELMEVITLFRRDESRVFNLPEHAEQELIALCELMEEMPSEEDSMQLLPRDISVFFTEQDGSETSEIIHTVWATLEYASEAQRPALIRNLEVKIAHHIKLNPDTRVCFLSQICALKRGVTAEIHTHFQQ